VSEPRALVRIRQAGNAHREWILRQAPRLHEFGPPPFRPLPVMDDAVVRDIARTIDAPSADRVVFLAEDAHGRPLGFAHVVTATDFFTGEAHGHLSDIVVGRDGEGRGIGRALVDAAEAWSRDRGHRLFSLHVFEDNARARALYGRLGYRTDTIKMMKELRPRA
jgi:GNAT superfamily N-acetyltransferase